MKLNAIYFYFNYRPSCPVIYEETEKLITKKRKKKKKRDRQTEKRKEKRFEYIYIYICSFGLIAMVFSVRGTQLFD